MTSSDSADLFKPKSKHAVHRLLELAEHKAPPEDHWHASISLENYNHRKDRVKIQQNRSTRVRQNMQRRKIQAEKQQLQLLADQTLNEQDLKIPVQLSASHEQQKKHERSDLNLKFIKNAKLRPFNSNMTFYNIKKQPKSKFVNTSLSFYEQRSTAKAISLNEKKSQGIFSSKGYQQISQFQRDKINNSVVYFTSNKSETVRQLLNRMSLQRKRGSNIWLHSTQRELKNPQNNREEGVQLENSLSQQQLKLINRYSKFLPFQKDQQLLYRKILQVDSIWLSKFKESWHRSKQIRDSRGRYLKKLIVK